jgi:hypothetical protein
MEMDGMGVSTIVLNDPEVELAGLLVCLYFCMGDGDGLPR